MKSAKKRSPFDLDIKPLEIPRFRISPDLLDIIAERRRKKRDLL